MMNLFQDTTHMEWETPTKRRFQERKREEKEGLDRRLEDDSAVVAYLVM